MLIHALWNVLILSVAVFIVARLLPGIHLKGFGTAVVVALVYSVVNFLLYRILVFLALPFMILTFGLFGIVINAFLLWLTDQLIEDFKIDGCMTTIVASVLISLANMLLQWLF